MRSRKIFIGKVGTWNCKEGQITATVKPGGTATFYKTHGPSQVVILDHLGVKMENVPPGVYLFSGGPMEQFYMEGQGNEGMAPADDNPETITIKSIKNEFFPVIRFVDADDGEKEVDAIEAKVLENKENDPRQAQLNRIEVAVNDNNAILMAIQNRLLGG